MIPFLATILIVTALLPCQEPDAELLAGSTTTVELRATDPTLGEGGASRSFSCTPDFSGRLYVWARSGELDPRLRVEQQDGQLVSEDDDSGGGNTACIVVLVEPGGQLYFGADAAFRALGKGRSFGWLPWLYAKVPGFALVAETLYGVVVRNRQTFSRITRLFWGSAAAGPSWTVGPWVFLRALALV